MEQDKRAIPQTGEIWQHFKQKEYKIIACPAIHTETEEPYCVYQALYGDSFIGMAIKTIQSGMQATMAAPA
ncbi:DUF1653 domain-containing protein [Selenomonas sp. GACV-9]|uniref:DUF1653 domain-containing protein n=1 Tax=Selenomonas sp. GACV-9 TaxID=3158782 RepID=UPI0009E80883